MITVVQRVAWARVSVAGEAVGAIDRGLLLLVGVERGDGPADADATARKVAALRLFPDRTPMDRSVVDVGGGCLVVSQFTLAAELRHGNRPDFTAAAEPAVAAPLYERVAGQLAATGLVVATGRFGAAMQVELANDGPVTVVLTVRDGKVVPRPEPAAGPGD
ncbi:MAG: D-tyrosyl-tRNA(Tyr) deacylase [Planctomycetes bacterium]|nr:D-tyrosyl-tRNA(Tyr) deacylase [Planctomycetota bacterium]